MKGQRNGEGNPKPGKKRKRKPLVRRGKEYTETTPDSLLDNGTDGETSSKMFTPQPEPERQDHWEIDPPPEDTAPIGTTQRVPGTRTKRTIEVRQMDRTLLCQLLRRGWSKKAIAEHLGVSLQMVRSDWKIVLTEMREARDEEAQLILTHILEQLSEVKKEAWEAWERSKRDFVRRTEEEHNTKRGGINYKVSLVSEGRNGDSLYLNTIISCIEKESSLLGVTPDKKMTIKGEFINWDLIASGVAPGPVPDEVEREIAKAIGATIQEDREIPQNGILPCEQSQESDVFLDKSEYEISTVDDSQNKPEEKYEPQTLEELESGQSEEMESGE